MEFTATYGSQTMNYSGWREHKGSVFGEFKMVPAGSGQFEMKPTAGAAGGGAAAKTAQAKRTALVTQLTTLGFPQWQCELAAEQSESVETCVEWLTSGAADALGADDADAPAPAGDAQAAAAGAAAGAGAGAAVPPEDSVQQLMAMGFARDRAVLALQSNVRCVYHMLVCVIVLS